MLFCVENRARRHFGMWPVLRKFRKFWSCEAGNALVEASVVVPVVLIIMAGGIELGRGLSYHHAADKAVRDAARYIARLPTREMANNKTRALNLVTYGAWADVPPSGAKSTLTPGTMTADNFTLDQSRLLDDGFVRLEAAVTYTFPFLSIISEDATLVFRVQHEQPFIGG